MTLHQIADAALLISQLSTLLVLRLACKRANFWHNAWTRDWSNNLVTQIELLNWERNAVLRDPKTGRYVKKVTT